MLRFYGDKRSSDEINRIVNGVFSSVGIEMSGLTMFVLGIGVNTAFKNEWQNMSLEDYVKWAKNNPDEFDYKWGGEAYNALMSGTRAGTSDMTEEEKNDFSFDAKAAIATFYFAWAIEKKNSPEGPMHDFSKRMYEHYLKEFNNNSKRALLAIEAFWRYFGYIVGPDGFTPTSSF
jgi:hypothetical protein